MTDQHDPLDFARDERDEVAAFMQQLAALPLEEAPQRRSADHLWWKAELLKRQDLEQRVTAPIEKAERIIIMVAILAAVVLLRWAWDGLKTGHHVAAGVSLPLALLGVTGAILALVSYFVIRTFFHQEA